MKLYRKKPSVIVAVQWTGKNVGEIATFCGASFGGGDLNWPNEGEHTLYIKTPSGDSPCPIGSWIGHQLVNGKDDFWPIAPEIFAATYEPASLEDAQNAQSAGQEQK